MLNAVPAALHLLNIREKFFVFFVFSFIERESLLLSNGRFCFFCYLWVEAVLKVAPQKRHLDAAAEIHHRLDNVEATTVSSCGGSLQPLEVEVKKLNLQNWQEKKGTHDFDGSRSLLCADVCTRSNDGIRKCSLMVPEYTYFYLAV